MRSILATSLCMLAVLAAACGGNGEGGGGPTAPPPPANRRQVAITFTLQNANASTIQEARLLLDNQVVDTYQGAATNVVVLIGAVNDVTPGTHTVTVTIVHQTRSPSQYSMGNLIPGTLPNIVVVNNDRGQTLEVISLPREVVSMRTGDTRPYTINVP